MGVQLSLWFGSYQNQTQQWLDWWDREANWLLRGLAAYWRSQAIGFHLSGKNVTFRLSGCK
ncbi:hypothetical protein [Microcoleus sp. T3_A4]|uniref:hypothetical protein n=1 Tax=Microcoleus sp. T3_A4 TaxID=2818968 RepID=UPI004040AC55